jgi:DNA-directed RNA polymerase subunit L
MFRGYTEFGPPLLTDDSTPNSVSFTLDSTSTTVANTLRRCILSETRSVGFHADLTNAENPGVVIRKNTSVIFNEMLAHRLTLLPLGVVRVDEFDPSRYECVLRNEGGTGIKHVTASDFRILERQADGAMADIGDAAAAAMFPPDPITKQTSLILSLRSQWNTEQPAEEIDLTAFPVLGRGRDHMGFCPVSQCSFENSLDEDPVRQEKFFTEWLVSFKKIADITTVPPDVIAAHRKEWSTMAIQRCFIINDKGEPSSFRFTVESVGIRPVKDIVAEGIKAVVDLVAPYANAETPMADLGLTVQSSDSRMNGIDVLFAGQEHTLGNLLQTLITELYLDNGAPDTPITYVGYKIRHPLHRIMTLRFGFATEGDTNQKMAIARQIITAAAAKAVSIFNGLASGWASVSGSGSGSGSSSEGAAAPELEG